MGFRVFRPSDLCVWTSHAVRRLAGDALVFGRSPETRGRAFVRRERHVVAVIDVVGFTARAAGHAASGIDGIEAIAHEVNACFGLLADRAEQAGGDVLRFVGDAVVVAFPDTIEGNAAAVALCVSTGDLQGVPADFTLRAGVARGEVELAAVGGVGDRVDLLVMGPAVARAYALAGSGAGSIVVDPDVAEVLGGRISGVLVDGVFRVTACAPAAPCPPLVDPQVDDLVPFVPRGLYESVRAGATEWLAEVRSATVIMVRLASAGDEMDATDAHQATSAVMAAIARVGGWFDKVIADDKGVYALATTGLPRHEDDARRAIVAALEIEGRLLSLGLRPAIGVASGPVVWGPVGSTSRREYTVLGAPVNTAARLMTAARKGVMCDGATVARTGRPGAFRMAGIRPLRGLGVVPLFRPLLDAWSGPAAGLRHTGALLGRGAETDRLRRLVDGLRGGEGGRLLIVGEAGAGKSRLVQWLVERAVAEGCSVALGRADAIPSGRLLDGWAQIVAAALGVTDGADPAAALVERCGDLAPLLGPTLGITMPENDRTRRLEAAARRDALTDLVVSVLTASTGPALLVIEDAHWMDALSWRVLDRLVDVGPKRGVGVVVTMRPETLPDGAGVVVADLGADTVTLGALAVQDVAEIAARRLGAPPSAPLAAFLFERGRGNPFVTEETVVALRDAGMVVVVDGVAVATDTPSILPASVADLVAARLDRLSPDIALSLKVASAIGEEIDPALVVAAHPTGVGLEALVSQLGAAARAGLVLRVDPVVHPADGSEPSGEIAYETRWRFRHAVHREVAYAGMLGDQRRRVHGAIARALARRASAPPGQLLFHWRAAGEDAEAVRYVGPAAEAALGLGAWWDAVSVLEYGLSIRDLAPEQRVAWSGSLGVAWVALGQHPVAQGCLEVALHGLAAPVPRSAARMAPAIVVELGRQVAHRLGFVVGDPAARARAAAAGAAYEQLGYVYYARGNTLGGVHAALRLLNLAEVGGPSALLARAYAAMALTASVLPLRALERFYLARAFAIADGLGDPVALAFVRWIAAMVATAQGKWAEAEAMARGACAGALECGDQRVWAMAAGTLASVAYVQGRLDVAAALADDLIRCADRARVPLWRAWGLNARGEALLASGQPEAAERACAEAMRILEREADRAEELRALGVRARAALRLDHVPDAVAFARAALALARTIDLTAFNTLEGFVGASEVLLVAHRRGLASRAEAKASVRALAAYTRVFPIGRDHLAQARLVLAGREHVALPIDERPGARAVA
jgi:class 3 adenylate cyclase/tetratricopeptide (TPR) repeat protein